MNVGCVVRRVWVEENGGNLESWITLETLEDGANPSTGRVHVVVNPAAAIASTTYVRVAAELALFTFSSAKHANNGN